MKKIQGILEKKACRTTLWLLLVLLTAAIFLFPTHLTLEYHSIQSAHIFDSLPLFGAVYFVWILVALTLLFSLRGEEKPAWQKLALVLIFALVFSGFWISITHGHYGEVFRYAAHTETLQREGNIPPSGYGYFNFPGLFILASSLCQITGLATFDAITLLLILQILLFAGLLFVLFRNCLKSTFLAVLGALLVIQGSMVIAKALPQFHPSNLGFLYFAVFLVLLTRDGKPAFGSGKSYLLLIILLAATTIAHFVTSYMFLFVVLGLFTVQILGREKLVRLATIALCVAIPLVWMVMPPSAQAPSAQAPSAQAPSAQAPSAQGPPRQPMLTPATGVLHWPAQVISNLTSGKIVSGYTAGLARAYFGSGAPPWATITRIFWIVLMVVFGCLLGLRNLVRARQLSLVGKSETGALLGVLLLGVLVALVGQGEEAGRFLKYVPFFVTPILLRFLFHNETFAKKSAPILLGLLLILSFPTFLAHNNTISIGAVHPHELAGGQFLRDNYDYGEDLHIYFINYACMTMDSAIYYVPNAYFDMTWAQRLGGKTPEMDYLERLNRAATRFSEEQRPAIFIFSDRLKLTFQHLLDVDPTALPQWQELKSTLSQENMIYNDGHVQYLLNHKESVLCESCK